MAAIDWDDLRFALAVAAEGSVAGAARAIGVNHTTVLRRLAAFERRLDLRLFERLPTGYVLTAGGEELVEAARRVDETVTGLERKLAGRDLELTGTLRVTSTDTLMASLLPDILAGFRAAHPGILVEMAVSNVMFSLTRRDADVAIRPAADPPDTLVGRRVSAVAFAIYAAPSSRPPRRPSLAELARWPWVAPDERLSDSSVWRWMGSAMPDVEVALRADSLVALARAAAAGLGLAALPCYLGDPMPGLIRVHPPVEAMTTALWVLTHADLRRTARVRVFIEFVAEALGRARALLEGRARPATRRR